MKVFVVVGGDSCGGSESCALGVALSRKAAEQFIDRIKEYEANIPQPEYPKGRTESVVHDSGKIATYSDIGPEAWEAYQQARREWQEAHPAGSTGQGFTSDMSIEEFDTLDELVVTVDLRPSMVGHVPPLRETAASETPS